jgi:hypothetical protein
MALTRPIEDIQEEFQEEFERLLIEVDGNEDRLSTVVQQAILRVLADSR